MLVNQTIGIKSNHAKFEQAIMGLEFWQQSIWAAAKGWCLNIFLFKLIFHIVKTSKYEMETRVTKTIKMSVVFTYMKDLTMSGSISPLRLSKYFFKS